MSFPPLSNSSKEPIVLDQCSKSILLLIERIFINITQSHLTCVAYVNWNTNCVFNSDCMQNELRADSSMSYLRPKRNFIKLIGVIEVLCIVYKVLTTASLISKRDIFYILKPLFKEQTQSDEVIKIVVSLLDAPRHHLNIVASSTGLCRGDLSVTMFDGSCIDFFGGLSIPFDIESISDLNGSFDYVLVVEKETVFTRLTSNHFEEKNHCLIITGKGFPSIDTRRFLLLLAKIFSVPFFCFVDADPHGLLIYSVYKFGSSAMCGEKLALSNIQWIGLSISELLLDPYFEIPLGLEKNNKRDMKIITKLLSNPGISSEFKVKSELEFLRANNVKAEVEILSSIAFDEAEKYISNRINFLVVNDWFLE